MREELQASLRHLNAIKGDHPALGVVKRSKKGKTVTSEGLLGI